MHPFVVIIVIGVVGFAATASWLVWKLIARPFAVANGMIPMTAYDHVVCGWKAERRGDWVAALAAYDEAIRLRRRYQEAHTRRDALLANHPELSDEEPRPTPADS